MTLSPLIYEVEMNLFMSTRDILKGIELQRGRFKSYTVCFFLWASVYATFDYVHPFYWLAVPYASSYPFLLLLLDGSVDRGEYGPSDLSSLSVECQTKRSLYSTC